MKGIETENAPQRFFRRIGFGFIGLAVILLLIVMYAALSRATIIIEPKEDVVNADLLATVREGDLRGGDILGKIDKVTVSREAMFTASGPGREAPAKASGEITIYNDYAKSQTLIATTRFLSEEGALFRLKNNVTVPAGAGVKALVYADKEGKGGEIGPTKFIIPGLAKNLQSKIYGKSAMPMTGGSKKVAAVAQKDIDDAMENLRSDLLNGAAAKLKSLLTDSQLGNVVYADSFKVKEANVKEGDSAENFKVKIELEVVGVSFGDSLQNQAAKTLANMISADRKLVSSNILEAKPIIEKYNLDGKSAHLKIGLSGKTTISGNSAVLDKEKLAGLTEDEVEKYLDKYVGVKSVKISYFPFKTKRIPRLTDHIKIVVK